MIKKFKLRIDAKLTEAFWRCLVTWRKKYSTLKY